jgi:hypothetical protein
MQATLLSRRFAAVPVYDETYTIRIMVTCSQCKAWLVGNADEIVCWQTEHCCAMTFARTYTAA